MNNKTSNKKRRKLLRSIAAGSGVAVAGKLLPDAWSKPVINSIILPAHAQMTEQECCNIAGNFCASVPTNGAPVFIDIEVISDGSIAIILTSGPQNIDIITTNVNCFGGTFSVPSVAFGFRVTGTVVCNGTEIVGQILANQPIGTLDYTATTGQCQ